MSESDIIYDLKDVSYSYLGRFPALNEINLNIRKGEEVALVGANGSGKSTLLLILAGLIFPKRGTVKFEEQPLREESFIDKSFQKLFRSHVGIVFQNSDVQLFNSSVEDEIVFGLSQLDLPKGEIGSRLERYMDLMKIAPLRDRHPQYLSVGEKKRIAIASVLAMEPDILLLDEPTSGLDPRTSRQLIDTIVNLSEKGYTIITSTQDVHIVSEIAKRIVVLSEGKRVVKDADARSVLNDKAFLEEHNLVHMHAHKHQDTVHVHAHGHPGHDHPHPDGSA